MFIPIINRRFGQSIAEFELAVPNNYEHTLQIKKFIHNYKQSFYSFDSILDPYFGEDSKPSVLKSTTDEHFANTSFNFEPAEKYLVKIFPILKNALSEDCLFFLDCLNAKLVGAQGLSLIWSLAAEQFPMSSWVISYAHHQETINGNKSKIPMLYTSLNGRFGWHLMNFDEELRANGNICLLCVSEIT